jgi:hypothetical protein
MDGSSHIPGNGSGLTVADSTDLITIPDAHLLFGGDFKRVGSDLIVSDATHEVVVHDYFRSEHRLPLYSPEGAQLSPDIVEALTGHQRYAQAGPSGGNAEVIGRVATVQGNATIIRNGVAISANVGDGILKGDVLQTTSGSIGVTFLDGSTLSLTPNARLAVSDFVFDRQGASNSEILHLVQGSLTFISGKIAHDGHMSIETPVATMGIRGTVGGITEANDGTVRFYVVQSETGAYLLDSSGTSIAQVVQNGPLIVVHPSGPLQIVAEEVQKTPAELAIELSALQQIINVKAIGDQLVMTPHANDHPHTEIQIDLPTTVVTVHTGNPGTTDSAATQTTQTATIEFPKTPTSDQTFFSVPVASNLPPLIAATISTGNALNSALTGIAAAYLSDGHDLINTLGGTNGFGTVANFLPDYTGFGGERSDDGSSALVDLTSVFGAAGIDLFGTTYHSLYINSNGNVTFTGPNNAYVPSQITAGPNNPIIAPFWADVDTRGGPADANTGGNSTGSNLVYYSLDSVNHVVTITWDDVGSYNSHTSPVNAFQLQLIGLGAGNFDIVFRYEAINWISGDLSGGVPAQAGYSAGDGNPDHYITLPQSGDANALLALPSLAGNTGINGVDLFQIISDNAPSPVTSGTVQFLDPDNSDTHSATIVAEGANYIGAMVLDDPLNNSSHVTEPGSTTPGTVAWHLDLTPQQMLAIAPNAVVTQSYELTISDNHNNSTAQQLSISIGGPGNDNFIFHASEHLGADVIANFNTASDTIELDGFSSLDSATLVAALTSSGADSLHGDAVINLGHGDSVTVANVTESYLQQHLNLIHLNSGVA